MRCVHTMTAGRKEWRWQMGSDPAGLTPCRNTSSSGRWADPPWLHGFNFPTLCPGVRPAGSDPTLRARPRVEVDLVYQLGGALAVLADVVQRQRIGLQRAPARNDGRRVHARAHRILVVGGSVDLLRFVGGQELHQ